MHSLTCLLILLGVAHFATGYCDIKKNAVSEENQKNIVNIHNEYRARVATGKEKDMPTATNMLQMVWDVENAQKAQEWANNCNFKHDTAADRDTGRGYTGQNLAYASNQDPNPDWNEMIKLFYEEVSEFDRSTFDKYVFHEPTGHFTQIIWAETYRVGCGYVRYQGDKVYKHLYVCNYLPGGNMRDAPIYEKGDPCSSCGGCGTIPGLCLKSAEPYSGKFEGDFEKDFDEKDNKEVKSDILRKKMNGVKLNKDKLP